MNNYKHTGSHYGLRDLAVYTSDLINHELEQENKKLKTVLDNAIEEQQKIHKCIQCNGTFMKVQK